ncbi:MAG: mechanosensitive ion channel family protein, partial [Halobacteria archaeon]|nr:mechanosensitive ion channel family protein [Halobacteria archaeon]
MTTLPFLEGVPYAKPITQAVYFVATFIAVYLIGRIAVVPLVSRALEKREMERHVRKPVLRLVKGVVLFVAVGVAFGAAGFGNFLTSLATI